MGEHTPGPWTVEEYGDEDCPTLVIHKDSVTRICFMATPGSHGDPAKIAADARLIAAAPDLLAALIALGQSLDFDDPLRPGDLSIEDPSSVNAAFASGRAAIAKATGSPANGEPTNGESEK